MKQRLLFIINPIAGTAHKEDIETQIENIIDTSLFDFTIKKTQYKGHGLSLAIEAVSNQFDIVVAVGGDGTVNEVASALVGTSVIFGIIPLGSGNGLARHLSIPVQIDKAIELINMYHKEYKLIDVGKINEYFFFSVAGIGYEAKVAHDFNLRTERGFKGYLKQIIKNYFKYNSDDYIIHYEEKKIEKKSFFITFGNSSQWGYNIKIQPSASVKDGKINMLMCKKPNLLEVGYGVIELFLSRIEKSKLLETLLVNKVHIYSKNQNNMYLHIDGDAVEPVKSINVELLSKKLRIIAGIRNNY